MSVILDALKRSERDQSSQSPPQPLIRLYPQAKTSRSLGWTLCLGAIICMIFLILFLYNQQLFQTIHTTEQIIQLKSTSVETKVPRITKSATLTTHHQPLHFTSTSPPQPQRPKYETVAQEKKISPTTVEKTPITTTRDTIETQTNSITVEASAPDSMTTEDLILIAALQQALQAVDTSQLSDSDEAEPVPTRTPRPKPQRDLNKVVYDINDLEASWVDELPHVDINMHIFSSNPIKRTISVNGQELHEGDMISPELFIVEIRPEDVVFNFKGNQFKVAATQAW